MKHVFHTYNEICNLGFLLLPTWFSCGLGMSAMPSPYYETSSFKRVEFPCEFSYSKTAFFGRFYMFLGCPMFEPSPSMRNLQNTLCPWPRRVHDQFTCLVVCINFIIYFLSRVPTKRHKTKKEEHLSWFVSKICTGFASATGEIFTDCLLPLCSSSTAGNSPVCQKNFCTELGVSISVLAATNIAIKPLLRSYQCMHIV